MKNLRRRESPPVGATALRDLRLSPPSPSQNLGDRLELVLPGFPWVLLAMRTCGGGSCALFGGGAPGE